MLLSAEIKKTELIQYLHILCFIHTPRTYLKEIKNVDFITWSGLNNLRLLKHLLPRIETNLGHLDQEINNLKSTKPNIKIISPVKSEL